MNILIVSQVYWPDTASTAQHLADLGRELARRGHAVTAFGSRHAYEDPAKKFSARETNEGVDIQRLRSTAFGKGAIWKRLMDFASFNLAMLWKILWRPAASTDVVLGMTSPPLVSFLACLVARWKGWRFCYWTMDLQPELAIEAGMVKRGSLAAKALQFMGDTVFKNADRSIALDRHMAAHIIKRGGRADTTFSLPVWPVMSAPWSGPRLENPFRVAQGFGNKFVVMYSGNHAVVHPLDTILEAAHCLREDARFLFVFIGGGARVKDVGKFKEERGLRNILQLPYQPREVIHESLASADAHLVIMGDGQVGHTHPNKIYGAMFVGRAVVYIGPQNSHVTDILEQSPGNLQAAHGDSGGLAAALAGFCDAGETHWSGVGGANQAHAIAHFHPDALIPAMATLVEETPSSR
jgi:colanic acid biosynthesis glycosyl transferase WcaI